MRKCYKCNEFKSEDAFYNCKKKSTECIPCTKVRQKLTREKMMLNPEWAEKERERNRLKYYRLGYREKHKPTPEKQKEISEKYRKNHPEKFEVRKLSSNLIPETKGNNLHHWNYNIEFAKDVIELKVDDHYKIHRFIKYDKKTFMYKDLNGNLLDTREKHEEYIKKVLENF